jgi:hypothetical protein
MGEITLAVEMGGITLVQEMGGITLLYDLVSGYEYPQLVLDIYVI